MLTPVFWLHVPKTGTSFATALIHELNGSLPASAAAPQCDKHCLDPRNSCNPAGTAAPPQQPRVCRGSLDDLFERYPRSVWFRGAFSGALGAHDPLYRDVYRRNRGRIVGFFRDPLSLLASLYLKQRRPPGRLREPLSDVDFRYSVARRLLLQFANRSVATQVQYVAPGLRPDEAFQRVREGFQFVGLTERWSESICLFHLMNRAAAATGARPCLAVELANSRSSGLLNASLGAAVLREAGFRDEVDTDFYQKVKALFEERLATYGATRARCAALGC